MPLRPFLVRTAFALLLCTLPPAAQALQLGESVEQITRRHGAGEVNRAQQTSTYMWPGWRLYVQFSKGIASSLTYKKLEPLREPEILSLLASNGGAGEWQPLFSGGIDGSRAWLRKDGAIAEWRANAPLVLKIEAAGSARALALAADQPFILHHAPDATPLPSEMPPVPALTAAVEEAPPPLVAEPLSIEPELTAASEPVVAALPELPALPVQAAPAPVQEPQSTMPYLLAFALTVGGAAAWTMHRRRSAEVVVELVSNTPEAGSRVPVKSSRAASAGVPARRSSVIALEASVAELV